MNHEVEEILNVINDLTSSKAMIFYESIIGILATFLTITGLSLGIIITKLLDYKNRKTVKYVICNKVRNYAIHLSPMSQVIYCIKLLYFFLFPALFAEFTTLLLSMHGNYKLIISIQVALIIISCFVKKIFIRCENSVCKITAIFFPLIIIIQISLMVMTYTKFLYKAIVFNYIILDCDVLLYTYKFNFLLKSVKNKFIPFAVIPRHLLLFWIFFEMLHGTLTNAIISLGLILWELSVIIELLVDIKTSSYILPVDIHTVECVKKTKSRIMQYECNKIKYKLEDGTIEIVDEDSILYMSYIAPERFCLTLYEIIDIITQKYMQFKKFPLKNSRVECLFRGKELEEIQTYEFIDYKYIKESWIRLEVRNGDHKYNIIVNANRVKKIIQQNKDLISSTGES